MTGIMYKHTPRSARLTESVIPVSEVLDRIEHMSSVGRRHALAQMNGLAVGQRFMDLDNMDYWERIA